MDTTADTITFAVLVTVPADSGLTAEDIAARNWEHHSGSDEVAAVAVAVEVVA